MKKTKIICSIGPASSNPNIMCEMVRNGMNVARVNFSHATLEERQEAVSSVKKVREMTGENIAILYDTKGPEFRNGILENGEIKDMLLSLCRQKYMLMIYLTLPILQKI